MAYLIDFIISFLANVLAMVLDGIRRAISKWPAHALTRTDIRSMERRLNLKYRCVFKIADKRRPLSALIADSLADEVIKRRKNDPEMIIRIGVVCGPMITEAFSYMARRRKLRKLLSADYIQFVAMNRAGDAERYQYAANYQVTRFTEMFKGSKALACTQNPFDGQAVNDAREQVDILICSAGRLHADDPSYILEWHKKMGHVMDMPAFPNDCVGDFCLMPIDFHGRVAGDDRLVKLVREQIDPYPRFEWLGSPTQNGQNRTRTIICPIRTREPLKTDTWTPPDKESVASAILRSGIVDTCILEYPLARNLDRALGWFVFEEVSDIDTNNYCRICTVSSLKTQEKRENVWAYDPHDRLKSICRLNTARRVPHGRFEYPEIIVSEYPPDTHPVFDTETKSYSLTIRVEGKAFDFSYGGKARKPGQWSLGTYATVKSS